MRHLLRSKVNLLLYLIVILLIAQVTFPSMAISSSDTEKVTAYFSDSKNWVEIPKNELQKDQEFLCGSHLCYFFGKFGLLRMNPDVDIKLLPESDRSYDENNWRFPEPTDVVRYIDKLYKHIRHDRMGSLKNHDRFFFQGKLYEAFSDNNSTTGLSIRDTGIVLSRVTKTFKHPNTLVDLTIYNDNNQEFIITGTSEHPFFVPKLNKYISMGELTPNTILETDDGSLAIVKSIKDNVGEFTVYNLEVKNTHNFYIASPDGGPIVNVHNTCECDQALVGRKNVDVLSKPKLDLQHDVVAHKGWYARKQHRKDVYNAKWSKHDDKHTRARDNNEARELSMRHAQYIPGTNNKALEKFALQKGIIVEKPTGGAFYSFYRSENPIGFDQGKETYWIRAEWSSGEFHGHPMSLDRVKKYLPNVKQ